MNDYTLNGKTYEVHDIPIASNTGVKIKGVVVFSVDGGPLEQSCVEFERKSPAINTLWFSESHLAEVGGLVDEVMRELQEAAAFRRDELREMN